jgi:hypothetical protein
VRGAELVGGDQRGHLRVGGELGLELPAALQEILKMKRVEIVGAHAQQEAVEDGGEVGVGRNLVGRADRSDQRDLHADAARDIAAFVEQGEERVEDRAVGLEDLVEEDDLALGHHPGGLAAVGALAEGGDVDRAEELVGLGESGEEVFEILRVAEAGERPRERALGGAGRADQHQMLAGQRRDEHAADHFASSEEPTLEVACDRFEAAMEGAFAAHFPGHWARDASRVWRVCVRSSAGTLPRVVERAPKG